MILMKRFSVILALLLSLAGARAEGPDDQYVRVYNLIQEADKRNSSGQPSEALPKYLEAQIALQRFRKGNPDWNAKVVSFRLNYVADKIAALSARVPAPIAVATKPAATPSADPAQPAQPVPARDWENQLKALQDRVDQLQTDKAALEAVRRYRAAHNIGHFRFVECRDLKDGRPDGDVAPWEEIRFPFEQKLRARRDLKSVEVQRQEVMRMEQEQKAIQVVPAKAKADSVVAEAEGERSRMVS